jgi:hypothetical protein
MQESLFHSSAAGGGIRKCLTLKKVPHHGSVENLIFTNVLGGFAPATVATPFAISVENQFSIAPISNV